jgi:hypothetical protein
MSDTLSIIGQYDVGSNSCKERFVVRHYNHLYAFLYNLDGITTEFEINNPGGSPIEVPGSAGDEKLRVFKSTDMGTTWSFVEGSELPIDSVPSFGVAFCVGVDRDTAYLIYVHNFDYTTHTYHGVAVAPWDMNTDTWGAEIVDSSVPVDALVRGTLAAELQSREVAMSLATRGPGDMVFFFSGTRYTHTDSKQYGRSYYATFDGEVFGAAVAIPGQTAGPVTYWPAHVACDTAGNSHFLLMNGPDVTGTNRDEMWHMGMDSSGVFGSKSIINSDLYMRYQVGYVSNITVYPTPSGERVACAALCYSDSLGRTDDDGRVIVYTDIRAFTAEASLTPASWTGDVLQTGEDFELVSLGMWWWMGVFLSISYNCHGVYGSSADQENYNKVTQYYRFNPIHTGELTVLVCWTEDRWDAGAEDDPHLQGHFRWFHGAPGSWSTVDDLWLSPTGNYTPTNGFESLFVASFGEIQFELSVAAPEGTIDGALPGLSGVFTGNAAIEEGNLAGGLPGLGMSMIGSISSAAVGVIGSSFAGGLLMGSGNVGGGGGGGGGGTVDCPQGRTGGAG